MACSLWTSRTDVFAYEPSSAEERARGWSAAVPLENSKNGIVLETLDLLLDKGKGRASPWTIDHELRVRVRHCLVVRDDFEGSLRELEWVRSHEQVRRPLLDWSHLPRSQATNLSCLPCYPAHPQGPRAMSDVPLSLLALGQADTDRVDGRCRRVAARARERARGRHLCADGRRRRQGT
jgi:hypothetical protein